MIYFISDTHFNHKNIIKYCNRPFNNVEEMNEELIKNWNDTVSQDDIIYHLGDFALGNKEQSLNIIQELNGNKFLILGNHDKWNPSVYESHGFTVFKNAPVRLDEYKLILSHYPIPDEQIPKDYINLHGHIHDKSLYNNFDKFEPSKYSLDKHVNLSCDVINFKPISLEQLLSKKMVH